MSGGPQPMERARRLQLCHQIAERVQHHYGHRLLALGVYGSIARGTDGPFSDIEMHCVLHGKGFETAHEWSAGPWKAEVDVYSEDVVLQWASEVDVDWPLTHGAYTRVLVLHDPQGFFPRLRAAAFSQPDQTFRAVIQDVIVGEIYERVGKIRNARASKNLSCLPFLAVELAKFGAFLLGLERRHLYTSSAHFLTESLSLSGRPRGYRALCRLVMAGELSDPARVVEACEAFWSGVESWAGERGFQIQEQLEQLLAHPPH